MQFAQARMVKPRNTELILVSIWTNSTKLIKTEQILAIHPTMMMNEYIV